MYTAFAMVYDRLMCDVDYDAWAAYYAQLLKRAGVSGGGVCECACGTGELTVRLQRLGYRMTGVDLSSDMLSLAVQKARRLGLDIPFAQQDMRALRLHRRQEAVLCTCDGVNYLKNMVQLRRFLQAAYAVLKPGGTLIFDLSTPDKLQNTLGSHTLGCQDEDVSYVWQNAYHPRTRTVDMRLSIFVRGEDGRYTRLEEVQTQRAYTQDELRCALISAGFVEVRFYGDRTFRAPGKNAARWHVVAKRSKEKK